MSILTWQVTRNLENSLYDYLKSVIDDDNIQVFSNGQTLSLNIQVGFAQDTSWKLPVISFYVDSKTSPRLSIGSNLRLKSYLMIVDIRALDEGMQKDLSDWLEETLNNGFPYNDYAPNESDPSSPIVTHVGTVSVDFQTNTNLKSGDNVDEFDRYRQNLSLALSIG